MTQVGNPYELLPGQAGGKAPGRVLRSLGPGLVTGAADDDPSGIAAYSQVGAQFGFGLCNRATLGRHQGRG
jgi:hypothetical protein